AGCRAAAREIAGLRIVSWLEVGALWAAKREQSQQRSARAHPHISEAPQSAALQGFALYGDQFFRFGRGKLSFLHSNSSTLLWLLACQRRAKWTCSRPAPAAGPLLDRAAEGTNNEAQVLVKY